MSDSLIIGTGVTEPIDFELSELDTTTVPPSTNVVDLTGVSSITLRLNPFSDDSNIQFTLSNKLSIISATLGQVRLSQDASDFLLSHVGYNCYFHIVDGTGKIIRFPSESNFKIKLIEDF